MKMTRPNVQLSLSFKGKLDAFREQGTTTSGFIRSRLEREPNQQPAAKTARKAGQP